MKFFLLMILLALYIFPAGAAEKKDPCILKNTMFCGKWRNTEQDRLIITGGTLVWNYGSYADCAVLQESIFQENGFEDAVTILECMEVHQLDGKRTQKKTYYMLKAYEGKKFHHIRLWVSNEPGSPYYTYRYPEDQASAKKRCPVFNSMDSRCWEASSFPYFSGD